MQELFNRHVAICFSESWRRHAQNGFQFYSPRTSVPLILGAIEEIERGSGTLKNLLNAASLALKQPLGDFMERVL
jgi:hypothetical protein